jgi:hypothetical protein
MAHCKAFPNAGMLGESTVFLLGNPSLATKAPSPNRRTLSAGSDAAK